MKTLVVKEELKTLAAKAELEAEHDKIVQLQKNNLSFFLSKSFFEDDGFENMFLYWSTLNRLEL